MFHCRFSVCLYQPQSFYRLLNHVWDKHSLERGFKYDCGISAEIHRACIKSSNVQLHDEPKAILFSESPFQLPCKKFSSEKALSQFIKQKENFVEPVEIVLAVPSNGVTSDAFLYVFLHNSSLS